MNFKKAQCAVVTLDMPLTDKKFNEFVASMGLIKTSSRYMFGNHTEISFNKIEVSIYCLHDKYVESAVTFIGALLRKQTGTVTKMDDLFSHYFNVDYQASPLTYNSTKVQVIEYFRNKTFRQLDHLVKHNYKLPYIKSSMSAFCSNLRLSNDHVVMHADAECTHKFVDFHSLYSGFLRRIFAQIFICALGKKIIKANWFTRWVGGVETNGHVTLVPEHDLYKCSVVITLLKNEANLSYFVEASVDKPC